MDEATLRSTRSFRHPLFSVLLPFGFLWLVFACLRTVVPVFARIPGAYPVLLLIATLSETAVSGYLAARRAQGILPRLRELVLLLIFSLVFLKLASGDVFRGDWTIGRLDIVLAMLLVAVEWLLALVIHAALRERELLLSLVVGKDRGELRESFRDMGTEAAASLAGLTRVRRFIVTFQVIAFLGVFFLSIARPGAVTPGLVVLALAHFAVGLAFFIAATGFREWQALMSEGFVVNRGIFSRRAGFAAVLCLAVALVLVPAVGREAPLPSSYLQAFMEWLQRITTLPQRARPYAEQSPDVKSADHQLGEQSLALGNLGDAAGNEALQRLLRILLLVVVAGGPAALLLVLLVAPLFRKREDREHPVRALRAWIGRTAQALARGLSNFLAALRHRPRGDVKRTSLRQILFGRPGGAAARPSDERAGFFQRLGLGREIRTFVKVIRWGERRGVRFHRSLGPREYAIALGAVVPEVRGDLEQLAGILEELLFSGRGLPPGRAEEFVDAARLVLRSR